GVVAAAWLGACAAEPSADPKAPAADRGPASSRGAPPESHGSSRGEAIEATIAAGRDGFRACFDTWSRKHPGEPGKVTLTLRLTPGGAVQDAGAETVGFEAPEVQACMVAHARTLAFPPSFDGKETRHVHPFNFNPL